MNDITLMPPLVALAAPVLWEPNSQSGERLVALVIVSPTEADPFCVAPGSHIVFPTARLKALLGARAQSAEGILLHVQRCLNDQLVAGKTIESLQMPFQGFAVGQPRRVRGYSESQLLDTAVRTVSAFGTSEGLLDDEKLDRRSTLRTGRFIHSVRSVFSKLDPDRRERFNKQLRRSQNEPAMIIDYAYQAFLMQVTSLPQTERQAIALQKEAESKMFELDITVSSFFKESPVESALLINTQSLQLGLSKEEMRFATDLRDRIYFMAKEKGTRVLEADSPEKAAHLLETLE